jgi:hypothetical protein
MSANVQHVNNKWHLAAIKNDFMGNFQRAAVGGGELL